MTASTDPYVLGTAEEELRRLLRQARAYAPVTEDALRRAALEEDHGRERQHAVVGGAHRVLVDVHLHEADPLAELRLQLLERSADGRARPAPGRPEVDDHGAVRLEDVGAEGRIRHLDHANQRNRPVRACRPRYGTRQIASRTMERLIFDVPVSRSANAIGISTTRKPARSARYVVSIWKA